jgi:hypothetical protein
MWTPWIGKHYHARNLLILGESCYSWQGANGTIEEPQPDHPKMLVETQLNDPPEPIPFMVKLTRAICSEQAPSVDRARVAWGSAAFTNFVPVCVGFGPGTRPSDLAWRQAAEEWSALLDALRPRNVIVLGFATWWGLPKADMAVNDDKPFSSDRESVTERMRGYILGDGSIARCWSHWYPRAGASWTSIRDAITKAEGARGQEHF